MYALLAVSLTLAAEPIVPLKATSPEAPVPPDEATAVAPATATKHDHPPLQTAARIVAGTGAVATVGGGVATILAYHKTNQAEMGLADAQSPQQVDERTQEYRSASTTYRSLRYVPIAGIAAIAIGLGIDAAVKPKVVFAVPVPGGALLGFRGVW